MKATSEGEHVPVYEVFQEGVLADYSVFHLVILEPYMVEMHGEDVLVEWVQIICSHHACQTLIIIRVFSDISIMKNTAILHCYNQINSIIPNTSIMFSLRKHTRSISNDINYLVDCQLFAKMRIYVICQSFEVSHYLMNFI